MLDLDYKALKILFHTEKEKLLKVGELAKKLNLPHSTIGSCIKRLEADELGQYERYNPVLLTKRGRDLAIELIRHSRLLEILLHNTLGLTEKEAHVESEKFNLLFSCKTINKICELYNHPKTCPCGEKIFNSTLCHCEEETHIH